METEGVLYYWRGGGPKKYEIMVRDDGKRELTYQTFRHAWGNILAILNAIKYAGQKKIGEENILRAKAFFEDIMRREAAKEFQISPEFYKIIRQLYEGIAELNPEGKMESEFPKIENLLKETEKLDLLEGKLLRR